MARYIQLQEGKYPIPNLAQIHQVKTSELTTKTAKETTNTMNPLEDLNFRYMGFSEAPLAPGIWGNMPRATMVVDVMDHEKIAYTNQMAEVKEIYKIYAGRKS